MTKAQKLLNDLPDAKDTMSNKLKMINDDLDYARKDLKIMRNSIEIYEEKAKKEIELTHYRKIQKELFYNDEGVFRYRMVYSIAYKF